MDENEQLFPLLEAGKYFPSPSRPHYGTIMRWAMHGVGNPRVRLQTKKLGGRRYTSREAIFRFAAILSGEPPTTVTAAVRNQQFDQAAIEVAKDDI
ncbi:MAG: DUF1580 domain-containing protein [Planctomycetota bacterium]